MTTTVSEDDMIEFNNKSINYYTMGENDSWSGPLLLIQIAVFSQGNSNLTLSYLNQSHVQVSHTFCNIGMY